MQTTLLSLAIAAILALLAALIGPYFIDWNEHRATFEQQASKLLGLPVRVSGPMDVRLLPSPSLVLSGVEIGKAGDPQAVRAKALGIEFALPPLLSGQLRAVEMRLIGPEVRLSLTGDGRAVLPNALAGMNVEALSIEKLTIEDARLDLSDAASGVRATLSKLWFNGEVRALPGPIRGEGAFVMDGALYGYRLSTARPDGNGSRVKFSLEPSDRPVVADLDGFLTADGATPRFEGQATIARRLGGKGDKVASADPWRIAARVKANAAAALFEQVEFQYGPDDRALKLSGAAEARFGPRPRLDVVLSARQLDADKLLASTESANLPPRAAIAAVLSAAAGIAPPPIPTQLGFGVDALTLGGATLQSVRGDLEFGKGTAILSGFEARAPGFTQLQASGRIDDDGERLSFTGPVDLTSVDPRAFADWLEGSSVAAIPSRPLRLRGDVTLGGGKVGVERLQADIDRKTFDGSIFYVFANDGARSRLDLQLRADELDFDALMQFAGSAKAMSDVKRPDDVSLALSLERLRLGGMEAGKTDFRFTLDAEALSVERLAIADLSGVSINGKGRIDLRSQSPRGGLTFNLDMHDASALAALASRAAPGWSEPPLHRSAATLAPAKLQGTVTVEPAGNTGASRAALAISGPVGSLQLNLKAALTGQWNEFARADVALDASLDAADVNALTRLAAAEKLVLAPRQPGTFTLALKGKWDGDLRLDTRIVSANLDARASGSLRPFAADGKSASVDIAIGKAELGIAGRTVPVTLRTRVMSNAFGARLDHVSATVAGATVQGNLGFTFDDTPVIHGDLKTDSMDVGALLAVITGLDAAASKKAANDKSWSEAPFAAPALPALSGVVKVEATRAMLSPSFPASNLRSLLRFTPTQIKAEAVQAELLGGRGSGEATLRRGSDGVGVQGRLVIKEADAAQLLFLESEAPLSGRAELDVQFEGAGLSPRALIGSLNGSGTLHLENAKINALDPKAFALAIRSVDQGLPLDAGRIRDVVSRGLEAGPLIVNKADAALTIAAGIARIETFSAQSEAADLEVFGSYNLASARIDSRLAITGPAVAGTPIRPELAVSLRGPVSAPERILDVSSLTGWLALRSVDRQTKRIEAIEQGRPAEASLNAPEAEPSAGPDRAPVQRARPQTVKPSQQLAIEPLPPAIDIKPAAGDRRRGPQRVDGANPFPQPLGNPFPQPIAPRRDPIFR